MNCNVGFIISIIMTSRHKLLNITLKRYASHSSHSWLSRQKRDEFCKLSRYHNYRSRAAFKLIQIDDKYKFLKPGKIVIDVGSAPGSWTQVICERLKLKTTENDKQGIQTGIDSTNRNKDDDRGICISLDLRGLAPVDGAICLSNVDFTSAFTQAKLLEWLDDRRVDCILSDMSPNACGQKYLDHERIMQLNYKLVPFATQVLRKETGVMLAKVLPGNELAGWVDMLRELFEIVTIVKPEASRDDSREAYAMCINFRG